MALHLCTKPTEKSTLLILNYKYNKNQLKIYKNKGIECCSEKSISFHNMNPFQINEILKKLQDKTSSPSFYDLLNEMIERKLIISNQTIH